MPNLLQHAILKFNFELVHVPAHKHQGSNGLTKHASAPGNEAPFHNAWVVSWPNAFPTDTSYTVTCALSLSCCLEPSLICPHLFILSLPSLSIFYFIIPFFLSYT